MAKTRLQELTTDIKKELVAMDLKPKDLNDWGKRRNYDWLRNVSMICGEVSEKITIELIEDQNESYWQATCYKTSNEIKWADFYWYTIILDQSFECRDFSTARQLARAILDLEELADRLTLTLN